MPATELDKTTYKAIADLKAYYRFESGALTTDSSTNSRTLTAIGTPTETTGYFGGGVQLASASSQAYSIADSADMKPTGNFTVGAWIKTSTTATQQGIFQSWHATNLGGILFDITTSNVVRIGVGSNTGAGGFTDVSGTSNVCDGNWHFVVARYNGSIVQIFVDGKLENGTARASGASYNATNYVRVGCENNTGTNLSFFNGTLDDVFFYNGIALSNEAIKEIYEGRSVGEFWQQSGLRALYHLSDTVDNSGNNYNFTNVNSVSFSPYGKFGVCADFGTTNTNKRLTVLNDLGITGGAISIGFWVRLNTEISSGVYKFSTQGDASTFVDYAIAYEYNSGTRQLVFRRTRRGVAGVPQTTHTITLGTSNWYFLVLTYDGTNIRGYVNGNLTGTTATSGNGTVGTIDEFTIGADFTDGVAGDYASCRMDEVFVFNRALSQQEIARYYQWSLGRFAETL